jgi:hypothetical protein
MPECLLAESGQCLAIRTFPPFSSCLSVKGLGSAAGANVPTVKTSQLP